MTRCPLCGAQRETHACSTVPPERPPKVAPIRAPLDALVGARVVLDPRRRGGSW